LVGGQNKVCRHGWVNVKAWRGGGGDMVKACSKFGARRASVRDTRLKEVMVRKRDN
jgi:hypothetical protein